MPGISSLIRSILLPRQLYAVVGQSSVEFISVGITGNYSTILSITKSFISTKEAMVEFASQLQKCGSYFGEPFVILLDVPEATLYTRRYSGTLPTQASETVEFLQKDGGSLLATASNRTSRGQLFTLQAIRKKYYEDLIEAIAESQLPVQGIGTIQAKGIERLLASGANENQILVIPFGSSRIHTIADDKGGMVCWTSRGEMQADPLLVALSGGVSSQNKATKQEARKPSLLKSAASLENWLSSIRQESPLSRLLVRNSRSTRMSTMTTALNSLRLLTGVLTVTLVICSLVALSSVFTDRGNDTTLAEYEQSYNRAVTLAQSNSSMRSQLSSGASRTDTSHWVSPILTLFCQQRFPLLYLRNITANVVAADMVVIEADGLSRSERSIFDLKSFIEQSAPDIEVTLATIRPEVVSDGQRVDTLKAFKLVVSSHAK
jgi:hypothetical protein